MAERLALIEDSHALAFWKDDLMQDCLALEEEHRALAPVIVAR